MLYNIILDQGEALENLRAIPKANADQIIKAIYQRLTVNPFAPINKSLQGKFKGCRRLRVGFWRVIYKVEGQDVFVLKIGHRSVVYDKEIKMAGNRNNQPMNKLANITITTCLAAFLAGCGDSGRSDTETKASKKDSAKAAKAAQAMSKATGVKTTGNAVTDYKAALDKLVETIPGYIAAAEKMKDKKPSLSGSIAHMEAMKQWGLLSGQLADAWKKATPAEREQLQKHADTVLEKMEEDSDGRNAVHAILLGISYSTMAE